LGEMPSHAFAVVKANTGVLFSVAPRPYSTLEDKERFREGIDPYFDSLFCLSII